MSYNFQAIILAAGRARRFNTGRTKLVEKICGQEMILYPLSLFKELNISTTLVLGYQREVVEQLTRDKNFTQLNYVYQDEQRGTGHAVLCSRSEWRSENILVMNGDMPLVTREIIDKLYEKHQETNAAISFVISHNVDHSLDTYGRIVKTENTIKIVEPKEFKGDVNEFCCVNAGIYLVRKDFLENSIALLQQNTVTAEFHITDLIELASSQQLMVTTVSAPFDHIRGVNTFKELWAAEQIKKSELIKHWMEHGVHFPVAQNVHLDVNITIGAGSTIGSGAQILQDTTIGKNCIIEEFVVLENSILADNCTIFSHCVIKDSHVGAKATIGPFAHLRNQAIIAENVTIGNFVEIKKLR
jgi:bifunctional UDP-N-acetylglucosamine pyrophosphorylase/glucosamine-1-phosphate N-acetyltransferase